MIGGGAGGVELLLSVRTRLRAEAAARGGDPERFSFALVSDGEILATPQRARPAGVPAHSARARHRAARAPARASDRARSDRVRQTARRSPPMRCWRRPPRRRRRGSPVPALRSMPAGSWRSGRRLQVLNDPDVFASGDCAGLVETPREKAGVIAVRAGPPLADNLRRRARGEPMKPWRPQRRYLALISTGERYAVASRGWFKTEGAWVWTLKDWIDRRWMRMYQDADAMMARMRAAASGAAPAAGIEDMRCGGCGVEDRAGPAVARAVAPCAGACRRRRHRPRRARRCRGDGAAPGPPSGADGRFLPRVRGRSLCVRRDRRQSCAERHLRHGWRAAPRARDRRHSSGVGRQGRGNAVPASGRRARLPRPRRRRAGRRPFQRGRGGGARAVRHRRRRRRSDPAQIGAAARRRAGADPAARHRHPVRRRDAGARARRWIAAALDEMRRSNKSAAAVLVAPRCDRDDRRDAASASSVTSARC